MAAPALIVVWLGAAAASIAFSLHMGIPGISSYSGHVVAVHEQAQDGLRLMLGGSGYDFFFDDVTFSPLPDVRVGDDVQILAETDNGYVDDQAGHRVISALAVESRRGEWNDLILAHDIDPFTPSSWPVHDLIRWLLLALGLPVGAIGLASLARWIPSRSATAAESPAVQPVSAPPAERAPTAGVPEPIAPPAREARGSARAATTGWLTLAISGGLDLVVIMVGGANACHQNNPVVGWGFVVLVLVPIALGGGGVTTLVLASREAGMPGASRAGARSLGVIALAMAIVAVPVNFFAAMSWVFCF